MKLYMIDKLKKEKRPIATFENNSVAENIGRQIKKMLNESLEQCGYGTDDYEYYFGE